MSRFEPDEFINDRYAAMEQRLQVRSVTATPSHLQIISMVARHSWLL